MFFKKIKEKEDDIFRNKLEVAETSRNIFKKNHGMMLYPVLGALFSIISFVLLIMLSKGSGIVVLALILWYLFTNILIAFFDTATVACTKKALNGGKPKFSEGIKDAFRKLNLIINLGVFNTFVGNFMNLLAELKLGKAFAYTGEIEWLLVTYFVTPVIALENKSVKNSVEESQKFLKRNWGKNLYGEFKISFISFIPFLIILLILIFSSVLKNEYITYGSFILTIFILILGFFMNFTLRSIFCTTIYLNAKSKAKK